MLLETILWRFDFFLSGTDYKEWAKNLHPSSKSKPNWNVNAILNWKMKKKKNSNAFCLEINSENNFAQ
jgi:hypothetical protein